MNKKVYEQINQNNSWYVGDQLAWAELPYIKPIYNMRKKFLAKIISQLQESKPSISILDYGCGDGYWSSILSMVDNAEVTGVDYNELRIERAKKNAPKANFLNEDICLFAEKNNKKFDLIWFSQVIEHIEDDEKILKQLYNILSPDGFLIVGTTNEGNLLYNLYQKKTNYRKDSDHVHFYTLGEITSKINKAGFKIYNSLYEPFFPGSDELFYKLMAKPLSRTILKYLSKIFPRGCTDYYFACKKK